MRRSTDYEAIEEPLNEYLKKANKEFDDEKKEAIGNWFKNPQNSIFLGLISPTVLLSNPQLVAAGAVAGLFAFGMKRFLNRYKNRREYYKNLENDNYIIVEGVLKDQKYGRRNPDPQLFTYGPYEKKEIDSRYKSVLNSFKGGYNAKVIQGKYNLLAVIKDRTGESLEDEERPASSFKLNPQKDTYKIPSQSEINKAKEIAQSKDYIEASKSAKESGVDPKEKPLQYKEVIGDSDLPEPGKIEDSKGVWVYAMKLAKAAHPNDYDPKIARSWANDAKKLAEESGVEAGLGFLMNSMRGGFRRKKE